MIIYETFDNVLHESPVVQLPEMREGPAPPRLREGPVPPQLWKGREEPVPPQQLLPSFSSASLACQWDTSSSVAYLWQLQGKPYYVNVH